MSADIQNTDTDSRIVDSGSSLVVQEQTMTLSGWFACLFQLFSLLENGVQLPERCKWYSLSQVG